MFTCLRLPYALHSSADHDVPPTMNDTMADMEEYGYNVVSRPQPRRSVRTIESHREHVQRSVRESEEYIQDFAVLYGTGPPLRGGQPVRSQSPPPDGLNEPGDQMTMSAEEYRKVLMGKLSEAQLERRQTKLRRCLREAVQKEAQIVFEQYFEGQCFDDAAAKEARAVCQRVAEERTRDLAGLRSRVPLPTECQYVDGALDLRKRTCGRCWQVKRTPGCGGCQCAVPWPRPPRHEQPPPHWHEVRPPE